MIPIDELLKESEQREKFFDVVKQVSIEEGPKLIPNEVTRRSAANDNHSP
jgi:hypothetical protein